MSILTPTDPPPPRDRTPDDTRAMVTQGWATLSQPISGLMAQFIEDLGNFGEAAVVLAFAKAFGENPTAQEQAITLASLKQFYDSLRTLILSQDPNAQVPSWPDAVQSPE
jgi:hypothetical protein